MHTIQDDVFGLATKAYIEGNKTAIITVNTNLTEDEELPVSYLFRKHKDMPKTEQIALSLCKGKLLDIGAGAGTHSMYLQEKGFDITALEPSKLCCEVMQAVGIKEVVSTTLENYKTEHKFDTILLLMNGIGLAGTLDRLPSFLKIVTSFLSPNGAIYLTSSDISYMFMEEDGSIAIDLNAAYYGEMQYEISFENNIAVYDWLYITPDILFMHAQNCGLAGEIIHETEEGEYLAVLRFV